MTAGHPTTTRRASDRELVVTRAFNAPARLVFEAWTNPEILRRWWVPASFGMAMIACEIDARTGGSYRFVFTHPDFPEPMAFFGRYLEVTPPTRLVWTNEEGGEAGQVSTLTLEERGGLTILTLHDLYPSKAALDEALANGSTGAFDEQFAALDTVLAPSGTGNRVPTRT